VVLRQAHAERICVAKDLTPVPLVRADLEFHGFPLKIEGTPPGNVQYIYEKVSATGPYTRPPEPYTRYGDVLPLLTRPTTSWQSLDRAMKCSSTSIRREFACVAARLGARLFLRR
jgi:hypothetical protein